MLALSLFIVAGCASVERAPVAADPAPDAAASTVSKEARPAKEIATAEPPQAEAPAGVVAEAPQEPERTMPPPPATLPAATPPAVTPPAPPVVTRPVQPAKPGPTTSAASRPAPAAKAPAPAAKAPASKVVSTASAGSSSASAQPARAGGDAAPAGNAGAQLNLSGLEQRLRDSNAIGVMTKITIKNQVDELLERFKAHHEGRDNTPLAQLRQPYDTLIMKVLSLLQDKDPSLARSIAQSREAIWGILTDRNRFSSL